MASGWRVIGPDGAVRRVVRPAPDWVAELGQRNGIAHASVMFRRDMVRNRGGYRPAFPLAEDYDLWRRLAEHHPMAALPEPLLDYREHAGQSTLAGLERRILSELAVHEAAGLRARGEADGMDGPAPAMPSAAAVREGMLPRALGAAVDAVAAGHGAAARAAIRLAWRQPGLRVRTQAHLALLWLQAVW